MDMIQVLETIRLVCNLIIVLTSADILWLLIRRKGYRMPALRPLMGTVLVIMLSSITLASINLFSLIDCPGAKMVARALLTIPILAATTLMVLLSVYMRKD